MVFRGRQRLRAFPSRLAAFDAAAGNQKSDLLWLIDSFADLPFSPQTSTSLYDSLGIEILWDLTGSLASRTLARRPVSKLFVHEGPLVQRKQVSLEREVQIGRAHV